MNQSVEIAMANILAVVYEEYEKGNEAVWDSVNAERAEVSEKLFIKAGQELKRQGYLPNFGVTKENNRGVRIPFIGVPDIQKIKSLLD